VVAEAGDSVAAGVAEEVYHHRHRHHHHSHLLTAVSAVQASIWPKAAQHTQTGCAHRARRRSPRPVESAAIVRVVEQVGPRVRAKRAGAARKVSIAAGAPVSRLGHALRVPLIVLPDNTSRVVRDQVGVHARHVREARMCPAQATERHVQSALRVPPGNL